MAAAAWPCALPGGCGGGVQHEGEVLLKGRKGCARMKEGRKVVKVSKSSPPAGIVIAR